MYFVISFSGSENPVEIEDRYQSASREAAHSLQASGPVAEPNYKNVNLSKKKKNTRLHDSGNCMPLHSSGRSWEINREQVKSIEIIGKGAFSQVAKATAWNIRADEEYTTVAVKMLKGAIKKFLSVERLK